MAAAKKDWKLEEFELGVTLGTGSFGRVRFAKHSAAVNKGLAIKMLKKHEVVRLSQIEHILAEKAILAAISSNGDGMTSHPFIVSLFCTFHDDRNLFMVLEYVNGGEFFTHLRRAGRLDNEAARFYTGCVATVFEHLHQKNIIYRDLKPENLLLDSQGFLKVTDFGFAKKVVFKTYTLCGTPEYIAPEVLLNKGHGKGVDWWTLGILMYEMLSGQPPFVDEDPMGIYQQILKGKITFPRYFDRSAKALIKKILTADLTKRLGCLKNGANDIKNHKWFTHASPKFDFVKLLEAGRASDDKIMSPPIKPSVTGPFDTSNFDPYPDSTTETPVYVPKGDDPFQDFADTAVMF